MFALRMEFSGSRLLLVLLGIGNLAILQARLIAYCSLRGRISFRKEIERLVRERSCAAQVPKQNQHQSPLFSGRQAQLNCLFGLQNRRGTVGRLRQQVSRLDHGISTWAVGICALHQHNILSIKSYLIPLSEKASKLKPYRVRCAEACRSNSLGCKLGVGAWQRSNKSRWAGAQGRVRADGKGPGNFMVGFLSVSTCMHQGSPTAEERVGPIIDYRVITMSFAP